MLRDSFRVDGRRVRIERIARSGPAARAGYARHRRDSTWQISCDGLHVGIAEETRAGRYTCARVTERDLRRLACRLIGADPATIER